MAINGARRTRQRPRGSLIGALDLGSSKVVCLIARVEDEGVARVIGIGHQVSRGLRAGSIVDMESAEQAIAQAVTAAEQMAGEAIDEVVVNLSGGQPVSQSVRVELTVSGREVGDSDLRRALRTYPAGAVPPDYEIVHAVPVRYELDGARGIRDPRGMVGQSLGIEFHMVGAASSAIRNLRSCIGRCHLEVDSLVVSAYAAGLACLVEDEMDLGATLIDMGGGTTSIAVFSDGRMVHADTVPVGGQHVTSDIARGLTTPIVHAERMKTLHGSALPTVADDREMIDVPQVGEEDTGVVTQVPKSLLTGIIQPRMEEIFEFVRSRLEASGFDKVSGRRVVLTGGASQLQGARELAQLVLDKQVRLGRPARLTGLAEATTGPAFSTAAGLLSHAVGAHGDLTGLDGFVDEVPVGSIFSRLGGWFRDHL